VNQLKLNITAVALVIILTSAFVLGLVRPGLKELHACHTEIADKQAVVHAEQDRLGNVGDLYESILRLDEAMRGFRVRLPVERRFGEFLNDLSEHLKRCKIDDYVVQPRPALRLDESKLPESVKLAAGMTILPVNISFRSSFVQLFDFLGGIESLTRLSHVESIKVGNDEQHPGEVNVEMTLHTYQYHDASASGEPG
jgi:Tfp pilus assembly protein PilO